MKLIIATPSPFARKARIALLEKGLPHELAVQNPWQSAIAENPLGKVPALVLEEGRVVHDSSVIVEYLETLGAPPPLIPAAPAERVAHRQVEAIADGICDAVVLSVLERARQRRKIVLGLDELERLLAGKFFTAAGYGLAEIATGCALGYLDLRYAELDWRAAHPRLAALFARLSSRPAFVATVPSAQDIPRQA